MDGPRRDGDAHDAARLRALAAEARVDLDAWWAASARRVPSARRDWGAITPPWLRERERPDERRRIVQTGLAVVARDLFDIRLLRETWDTVLDDPALVARLWSIRRDLYAHLRARGRLTAACPRCATVRAWSLDELAALHGRPPPALAEPDGIATLPSLASFRGPRARPGDVAIAVDVRAQLPSASCGIAAPIAAVALGPAVTATAIAALTRADAWAGRPHDPASPDSSFRLASNPSFAALVHLRAVTRLADGCAPTIDAIEAMPVVDAVFLDAAYDLVFGHDLGPGATAVVACAACATPYWIAG